MTDQPMTAMEFFDEIERFRRALARFSNARHTHEEVWYLNALAVSLTAVEMKAGGLNARADAFWPVLSAMWANRPMTDQEKTQHDELFRRWMESTASPEPLTRAATQGIERTPR